MSSYDQTLCKETALYILCKANTDDLEVLYKILYLADKLHLMRFGSFIYGEEYLADVRGPIPTTLQHIITNISNEFQVTHNKISASRDFNSDHISEATTQCINEIIEK